MEHASHRMSLNISLDDLEGLGVHRNGARAEDKPVCRDDCLRENMRHRVRCIFCQHAFVCCLGSRHPRLLVVDTGR